MIHLRIDSQGNIQLISVYAFTDTFPYTGAIPADFFAMVGLGKYIILMQGGQPGIIGLNPDFIPKTPMQILPSRFGT